MKLKYLFVLVCLIGNLSDTITVVGGEGCPGLTCHANATCDDIDDVCRCNHMFTGNGTYCEAATCENTDPCDEKAKCELNDAGNAFRCTCFPGYTGTGLYCDDVNECAVNNGGCHTNADCVNTVGSHSCTCKTLYRGNGTFCEEMTCENTKPCAENAICSRSNTSFSCTCQEGYSGNGLYCDDINECAVNNGGCHTNADCINTDGSYSCTCKTLYRGNGTFCEDVNECAVNNGGCHTNADCVNTDGSYSCTCKTLYRGNGSFCEEMTCENTKPCAENAICSRGDTSFSCTCQEGYSGNGLFCDALECDPKCGDNEACILHSNDVTQCVCEEGFKKDGEQCRAFCAGKNILYSEDITLTFDDGWLAEVIFSDEKCESGRSFASITCSTTNGNHQHDISSLSYVECNKAISSFAQVQWTNATTEEYEKQLAQVNVLVSSSPQLSTEDRTIFVDVIDSSSSSLQETKLEVSPETLRQVVSAASTVTGSFRKTVETEEKDITKEAQKLVNALEVFAGKVSLPSQEVSVNSTYINAKVTTHLKNESRNYEYNSESLHMSVPREALDRAKSMDESYKDRIVFVEYKENILFQTKDNASTDRVITAEVGLDVQIMGLRQPVEISSKTITNQTLRRKHINGTTQAVKAYLSCVYYIESNFTFSTEGCCLVKDTIPVTCRCNHLTSFAVLIENETVDEDFALSVFSDIGCAISILGLIITIVLHITNKKICSHFTVKVFLHVCLNLLFMYITFVFGISATNNSNACTAVAAILHYVVLALWLWITLYSYALYKSVSSVTNDLDSNFLTKAIAFAYGVPVIAVLVTVLFHLGQRTYLDGRPVEQIKSKYCDAEAEQEVNKTEIIGYRADHTCWLIGNSLKFGFLLPAATLLLINYIFYILIIRSLTWRRIKMSSHTTGHSWTREVTFAISIATTLGLTWIFGYLMLFSKDETYQKIMAWIFTITNVFQGFLVFVLSVLRRADLRAKLFEPVRSHIIEPVANISHGFSTTVKSMKNGGKYNVNEAFEESSISCENNSLKDLYRANSSATNVTNNTIISGKSGQ